MTAPDTLPPELAELGELLREDPPAPRRGVGPRARRARGRRLPPAAAPLAVVAPQDRTGALLVPAVGFACVALLVVGLVRRSTTVAAAETSAGVVAERRRGRAAAAPRSARRPPASQPRPPSPARRGRRGSPSSDGRRQPRAGAQRRAHAGRAPARDRASGRRDPAGDRRRRRLRRLLVGGQRRRPGGSFELRIPAPRLQRGARRALAARPRFASGPRRRATSPRSRSPRAAACARRGASARDCCAALADATTRQRDRGVKAAPAHGQRAHRDGSRVGRAGSTTAPRYANVSVALVAERDGRRGRGGDDGRWTPGDALRDAVRVLEVAAGIALIVLALALPLALLGALGGARRPRGSGPRRRERALDMA